ncbi:hypothetical protein GGI07_001507 [Coemansia sp. Benny D115]|nr:hypothetical protein GGI07_001507 [Coemansia sp. Benny D115]
MRVPFFRSKDPSKSKKSSRRSTTAGTLDGVASESDLASAARRATVSQHGGSVYTAAKTVGAGSSAVQAIVDQMVEMEGFLTTIDSFQSEARRLFPENMALDQILGELRDECRRRVDYMSRVSGPPAWMTPPGLPQLHRPASSSSTTIEAMPTAASFTAATPGSNSSTRNGFLSSTLRPGRGAAKLSSADSSPISTATVTSASSSSVGSESGRGSANNNNNNGSTARGVAKTGYFSRRQPTTTTTTTTAMAPSANPAQFTANSGVRRSTHMAGASAGISISISSNSAPSSPTMPQPPRAQSPAGGSVRRDPRVADQRRKTSPQSMFVSSSSATDIPSRTMPAQGRLSSALTGSMARLPRASMVVTGSESPRVGRQRTSSADVFARPQSFVDAAAGSGGLADLPPTLGLANISLNTKGSSSAMRTAPRQQQQQQQQRNPTQHMPGTPMHAPKATAIEYLLAIKLAGHKVEAVVSPSLQTSLVSMQLAKMMGMIVTPVPGNARVWSSGGKSWAIVGDVAGLPFVCGNMSFTHSFRVVQGSAATNDMARDIMLGNDFCVGNKGRIKDNQLHLESLCMPVTVPVRQISATN